MGPSTPAHYLGLLFLSPATLFGIFPILLFVLADSRYQFGQPMMPELNICLYVCVYVCLKVLLAPESMCYAEDGKW